MMEHMKQEYENVHMSDAQVNGMKLKIKQAKAENRRASHTRIASKVAAAALAVCLILPNVSATAAYAMGNLPVIGNLVKAVTLRDYNYHDEHNTADISVPEVIADAGANVTATAEINSEIKQVTDQIIAEFEANLKDKEGYQNYTVTHETIATTEPYFTLKLRCFQNAGSGSEWDYYYTIDQATGNRVQLADLFWQGADYVTAISNNIKQQMRAQMAADPNKTYWIDTKDLPQMDFTQIQADQSFYLNPDGKLVIAFNEGEAGPMSMGCVEFVIDDAAISGILR